MVTEERCWTIAAMGYSPAMDGHGIRRQHVAVIGTGTMGLAMARNLARAGLDVRAWDKSIERAMPLADDGVTVCSTAVDAAIECDFLLTMVPDAAAVLDSAPAALGGMAPGGIWIQSSTIGDAAIERCLALAAEADVEFVDAPVLGTREPAEAGALVVLAAGSPAALDACAPVFDAIAERVVKLGDAGSGTRLKLAINTWIIGQANLLAETLSLVQQLGGDPLDLFGAVKGGPLEIPQVVQMRAQTMLEQSFSNVTLRLTLARKDAELALEAARQRGLELPILAAIAERMRSAERAGHGDLDYAATYLVTAPTLPAASGPPGSDG